MAVALGGTVTRFNMGAGGLVASAMATGRLAGAPDWTPAGSPGIENGEQPTNRPAIRVKSEIR